MPLAAEIAPQQALPPAPDAFASLLAALAAPVCDEDAGLMPNPGESDLKEDIVALSCEIGPSRSEDREMKNQAASFTPEKRSASVTLRMSRAECDQIRQRAAEAGLTVSAYLRSCALEAESLRAQVKDALAAMRAAAPQPAQRVSNAPVESVRRWWFFCRPAQN